MTIGITKINSQSSTSLVVSRSKFQKVKAFEARTNHKGHIWCNLIKFKVIVGPTKTLMWIPRWLSRVGNIISKVTAIIMCKGYKGWSWMRVLLSNWFLQLDWPSEMITQQNNLPWDQEGYDGSKTTYKNSRQGATTCTHGDPRIIFILWQTFWRNG